MSFKSQPSRWSKNLSLNLNMNHSSLSQPRRLCLCVHLSDCESSGLSKTTGWITPDL